MVFLVKSLCLAPSVGDFCPAYPLIPCPPCCQFLHISSLHGSCPLITISTPPLLLPILSVLGSFEIFPPILILYPTRNYSGRRDKISNITHSREPRNEPRPPHWLVCDDAIVCRVERVCEELLGRIPVVHYLNWAPCYFPMTWSHSFAFPIYHFSAERFLHRFFISNMPY